MKDKIYAEYGIKVNFLVYKKNHIFFEYGNESYMVVKTNLYETDLDLLSKIVDYADSYAVFFHKILSNKHGFIFEFGSDRYVILKMRIVNNRTIGINEILKVSNIMINVNGQNFIENKIDFLEKYLANYENLDLTGVNYFIGLSENAISLFDLIGNQGKNYINHKRIDFKETTLNFYNPLNIVLDHKTRDLAEYAKSFLLNGDDKFLDFLNYINYDDYVTYFARLMYPSFYFDFIDDYIKSGLKLNQKRISLLANSYEQSLKKLYKFIGTRVAVPNIEWLSDVDNF